MDNIFNKLSELLPDVFITEIDGNNIIFQQENDIGCIEYKRTLTNTNDFKLEKYATQMQYRIFQNVNKHFAIYYIGIDDDGSIVGISENDIIKNLELFNKIVNIIGAEIISVFIIKMIVLNDIRLIIRIKIKKNDDLELYLIDF